MLLFVAQISTWAIIGHGYQPEAGPPQAENPVYSSFFTTLSLPLFMLRDFANDVDGSPAADDPAFFANFFHGTSHFHLFHPERDASPREIIRGEFQFHAVPLKDSDVMHPHFS